MKILTSTLLIASLLASGVDLLGYTPPSIPYAPAAGLPGSTAIPHDSESIVAWATHVVSVSFGPEASEEFRNLEAVLGPAGSSSPDVLVLGRGGSIVLEFMPGIADREGWDFAVFENAFRETFLELAYVEVSSDGVHFVRFPNYSLTADPVGAFGDVQPSFVDGLAGKYRSGYGTPFDLNLLASAYEAAVKGEGGFSAAFADQLIANYPSLDLQNVNYVRILDIVGDGTFPDCEGYPVYDPYPTIITAGFDLDAVGVLNTADVPAVTFASWAALFGINPLADEDLDGDRWNNYMEYLFGSDPVSRASVPDPNLSVSPGGSFDLQFWRNLSSESVPGIEVSTDGLTWSLYAGNEPVNPVLTELRDGYQMGRIDLSFPDVGERFFLRFVANP